MRFFYRTRRAATNGDFSIILTVEGHREVRDPETAMAVARRRHPVAVSELQIAQPLMRGAAPRPVRIVRLLRSCDPRRVRLAGRRRGIRFWLLGARPRLRVGL